MLEHLELTIGCDVGDVLPCKASITGHVEVVGVAEDKSIMVREYSSEGEYDMRTTMVGRRLFKLRGVSLHEEALLGWENGGLVQIKA